MYDTLSTPLFKALATPTQQVEFQDLVPVAAQPTTEGVYSAGHGGSTAPQQVLLLPYGTGNAGDQFRMRLYGWWPVDDPAATTKVVWLPLLLCEFTVTLGNQAGVGNRLIASNDRIAATITLDAGTVGTGVLVSNPVAAWVKVDLQGCRLFQFDFEPVLAGMAYGNCLFGKVSSI